MSTNKVLFGHRHVHSVTNFPWQLSSTLPKLQSFNRHLIVQKGLIIYNKVIYRRLLLISKVQKNFQRLLRHKVAVIGLVYLGKNHIFPYLNVTF